MIQRGIATFGLDYGKCPPWLFERMTKLGREMVNIIVAEYGPEEFIKRMADPVWFQSLGTVLAFDWNASGLTTTLTGALKEAVRGQEKDLGIFICGGKGKTSRKTPDQILGWSERLSMPEYQSQSLVYNSRISAKVDSAMVQDGFQLYHHVFLFTKSGHWTVVQQGMNTKTSRARRYHWFSKKASDLIREPHSGIASQGNAQTLNLTSALSDQNRQISLELIHDNYYGLMKDIQIIRRHSNHLSQMIKVKTPTAQLTLLNLESREFKWHPMINDNFSKSKYLDRILWNITQSGPNSYEKLLALPGVGPKTLRALSLVSEVIYGAKPSYEDPARYSFAFGGKDATPYPVDRENYDQAISFFKNVVPKMKISPIDKNKILNKLAKD